MMLSVYFQNILKVEDIDPNLVETIFSLRKMKELSGVKVFVQDNKGSTLQLGEDDIPIYPIFPDSGIMCYVKRNGNGKNNHVPLLKDSLDEIHDGICHFLKMQGVDNFVITFEYLELDR